MRLSWIVILCILPGLLQAGFVDEKEDPRRGCGLPFALLNPAFTDTDLHVVIARPHVMTSNFSDRAVVRDEGVIRSLEKSLGISDLKEAVAIEPTPGTPCCFTAVRVYLRGESAPREMAFGPSTRKQSTHYVPRDNRIMRIEFGSEGQFSPGLETRGDFTDDKPPQGYRYAIRTNSSFFKSGLSGGHSRSAWDEAMNLYADQIEVMDQKQVKFRIGRSPSSPLITATNIQYKFGPPEARREVGVPKTIIESESDRANVITIELAIGSALDKMKESIIRDQQRLVKVPLPFISEPPGQQIQVRVALDNDALKSGTLETRSWWVDSSSFQPTQDKP